MPDEINVKIKRFDKSLPLPEYKTKGAAGFDLYARETVTIPPHDTALIPLNVAVEIPKGYFVLLACRSSTYKFGITEADGIGIGDSDYCGDNDEYHFPTLNFTDQPITIERGTRFAQMVIIPIPSVTLHEVDKLQNPNRGAFGTTGHT